MTKKELIMTKKELITKIWDIRREWHKGCNNKRNHKICEMLETFACELEESR